MKLFKRGGPAGARKAGSLRVLKNGAYSAILTAVVLAAVILLNLVMGALPTKYTQFDISLSGLFTLSDTTTNLLHTLDRDVTAYYLGQSGREDENITRLLDRYAGESSHFSWQQRDPVLYPTFAQQYGAQNATESSVILVCGDKSVVVDYTDMYEAVYSGYSIVYNFAAESALSSGISRVISDSSYVLYQLTGHGEGELSYDFADTLENSNVSVQTLNLLSAQAVPEDAAALLINVPQVDYTAESIDLLRSYLEGGGALIVVTGLDYNTPNLDALLAEYGMTRQSGLLVETDTSRYMPAMGAACLLPALYDNEVTSGVTDGMSVVAPLSQGILTDTETANCTYLPLLCTGSSAFAMQDYASATTAEPGANDPTGSFDLAVAVENSSTGARVVWLNCEYLLSPDYDYAASGANSQLFGSIVNWINGEENAVVIDSKSMSAESLSVPGGAVIGLGLLFVILVPVGCIAAGVIVWVLRRRR